MGDVMMYGNSTELSDLDLSDFITPSKDVVQVKYLLCKRHTLEGESLILYN